MTAQSLAEFLTSRFDEDERMAIVTREAGGVRIPFNLIPMGVFDPARVLADVEAKRRLLALHAEGDDGCCGECADKFCVTPWDGVCEVAAILALPYADHPDWREEWRA